MLTASGSWSCSAPCILLVAAAAFHSISAFVPTQSDDDLLDGLGAWYVMIRIQKTASTSIRDGLHANFQLAARDVHQRSCLGLMPKSPEKRSLHAGAGAYLAPDLSNPYMCWEGLPSTCDHQPLSMSYCDACPINGFRCEGLQASWRHAVVQGGCDAGVMTNPHMSYSALLTMSSKLHIRTRFIVMLRHPVKRALSEFIMILNDRTATSGLFNPDPGIEKPYYKGSWEYDDVRFGTNLTLETWMRCVPCRIGWNNRHVRMLGLSVGDGTSPRHGLLAEVTEAVYAQAERNLDAMLFVGIVERFAESWELLAATFSRAGLPVSPEYPKRRNVGKPPLGFEPSAEQRRVLAEANAFDMRLYERGLARLTQDLAKARESHLISTPRASAREPH